MVAQKLDIGEQQKSMLGSHPLPASEATLRPSLCMPASVWTLEVQREGISSFQDIAAAPQC